LRQHQAFMGFLRLSVAAGSLTIAHATSSLIISDAIASTINSSPPLASFLRNDPTHFTGYFKTENYTTSASSSALSTNANIFAGYKTESLSETQDTLTNFQSSDELEDIENVLFEADEIYQESNDSPIIAKGNVRAYFGERYLTAGQLIYYPETNIVIADGTVSITDAREETIFAERVELTGDLRDGIAENFSALLAQNTKIAADSAIREQGARTHLNKVVYTTCDVCKEDGDNKTPTWRIKSLRVTRDEERRVIRFRHAFLELKGVPILYTPFLQAPDPSVERQSGFLTPTVGTSSRLSGFIEVPYYFAISNHQDFTFAPKFTLSDGVLWQGEYRRAGRNSFHVFAGGVIDFESVPIGPDGLPIIDPGTPAEDIPEDAPSTRWYYFGRGFHRVNSKLRLGYDIERTSDDTFLRRYAVQRRGDLRLEFDRSRTNRLRSNINAAWQSGGSTFTADSYLFQGLRATDDATVTPFVLPLLNFRHDFNWKPGGGNLSINTNFAALQRTQGVDTRRLTTQAQWNREYITRGGHRFNAFAEIRGDGFFFADLDQNTDNVLNSLVEREATDSTDFTGRFTPSAGVEWSYPVARPIGKNARLLLEPRVQLVVSPSNRNNNDIINEDSQSTEFDFINLFDANKSTGFDAIEDGQRLNVGLLGTLSFNNNLKIEGAIGQQYRVQETNAFSFGTGRGDLFADSVGLGGETSDFVGEANILYGQTFRLNNKFRFNTSGELRQVNSSLGFDIWRLTGNITYIRLDDVLIDTTDRDLLGLNSDTLQNLDQIDALSDIAELNALLRFRLTKYWSIGAAWRENLRPNFNAVTDMREEGTIRQDFLIGYRDECSSFDVIFRRDLTTGVGLNTDTSVLFRFTLNSLTSSSFGQ